MSTLTKKRRLELAREIIDRNTMFVPFSKEDLAEFSAVCGTEIHYAEKRRNPEFKKDTRHVYMMIEGRDLEAVSWKKLIVGTSKEIDAKKAMRRTIALDMNRFKRDKELVCEVCKSIEYPTVDHIEPSFDWIAQEFIRTHGLPEIGAMPDRSGNHIVNRDVKWQWINFHKMHAKYQILCRSCNSSKGNRNAFS